MHLPRVSSLFILGLAASLPVLGRAADVSLPDLLPATTSLALHARNITGLRTNWERTPFAHTWAEPDVQKFFAPLSEKFSGEGEGDFAAELKENTGLTPAEMLEMFPGEAIFALIDIPMPSPGAIAPEPKIFLGAQIGSNRAKIEEMLRKAAAKSAEKTKEHEVEEEFQGETLHVTLKPAKDGSEEHEAEAWAIVGETLLVAEPKALLQEIISNLKRGGATDSLGHSPGFAAINRNQPDADVAVYLNLETFISTVVESMTRKNPAAVDQPPSQMEALGLTPDVLLHALGLDALTSLYVTAHIGPDATTIASGLQWREQRGLLKIFTLGDAPAPTPGFIPDSWPFVATVRMSIPGMWSAIRETVRGVNPIFDDKLQEQIDGLNKGLGIDIERDLIGSFGDEIIEGYSPAQKIDTVGKTTLLPEPFFAISLSNGEAFKGVIDAAMNMVPAGLAKQIVPHEYLGETVQTFSPPVRRTVRGAASAEGGFSYAITKNYLFFSVGSSGGVESAIQGQNGTANSFWNKPAVKSVIAQLPPGGSAMNYYDARTLVTMVFDMLAATPQASAPRRKAHSADDDDDDSPKAPERYWDASAKPSAEAIEKHWKGAGGASYRDADGLHSIFIIQHAE